MRRDEDGARLRAKASDRLTPIRLDVTDDAGVTAAFDEIRAAIGDDGLAGLVSNAGVARGGPIEFMPVDEWRDQRHRYLVGTDAAVAGNLIRLVPDRLWARLSRRLLSL